SSSSFAQRVLEYFDAMPFSVCARHGFLACFRTISLRLDPGLVVGHPRTILVGSSAGGSSVLPSKASTCFMGQLQTLASFALELNPSSALSCFTKQKCCS